MSVAILGYVKARHGMHERAGKPVTTTAVAAPPALAARLAVTPATDPEMPRYLAACGIAPGDEFESFEREPVLAEAIRVGSKTVGSTSARTINNGDER